jgi:GTP 3',8-cyclase
MLNPYEKKIKFFISEICNERCVYCPIHGTDKVVTGGSLTPDQIHAIAKEAHELGYHAVKVSGEFGDPLVTKNILEICSSLAKLRFSELSIATNGIGLKKALPQLLEIGVTKFCISLDTLNDDKYRRITGSAKHAEVIEGIRLAAEALRRQVKINVVVLRRMNDDEIPDLREFTRGIGATLQLIELFAVPGREAEFRNYFAPLDDLRSALSAVAIYRETYRPRCIDRFVLSGGEHIEITSTRTYADAHFGALRLVVHPNGDVGNYDVRKSGKQLTGNEPAARIREYLTAAANTSVLDIGKPGVEPWRSPSARVS